MADLIDINAPDKWGNGPDTKPPHNGGGGGGMAPMQPGLYLPMITFVNISLEIGIYNAANAYPTQPTPFSQPAPFSQPPKLPDLPPATQPTQQTPTQAPFQYPTIQPSDSMRKASDSLPSVPGDVPSESEYSVKLESST